MNAVAEIQVLPIDSDVPIREAVETALRVLEHQQLELGVHTLGTEVRGRFDEVLGAIERIHEELHARGIDRVGTTIKLETRNGIEHRTRIEDRTIDSSARPTGSSRLDTPGVEPDELAMDPNDTRELARSYLHDATEDR